MFYYDADGGEARDGLKSPCVKVRLWPQPGASCLLALGCKKKNHPWWVWVIFMPCFHFFIGNVKWNGVGFLEVWFSWLSEIKVKSIQIQFSLNWRVFLFLLYFSFSCQIENKWFTQHYLTACWRNSLLKNAKVCFVKDLWFALWKTKHFIQNWMKTLGGWQ